METVAEEVVVVKEDTHVPPKFDFGGEWVTLGGKQYKVAPLPFKALKKLTPRIANLKPVEGQLPSEEAMDTICDLALSSIQRHYPDLSKEWLEDMLDTANMLGVLSAIMKASNLEGGASGEAQAAP